MAVICVIADMGGGKSYLCCREILKHLGRGGLVYTNLAMRPDPWIYHGKRQHGARVALRVLHDWELQEGQIVTLKKEDVRNLEYILPRGTLKRPVLVVIDEALENFSVDDEECSSKALARFYSFLRHSRKLHIDVYFIAQSFNQLPKRIKDYTNRVWRVTDMAFVRTKLGFPVPPPWRFNFKIREFLQGETRMNGLAKLVAKDPLIMGAYETDDTSLTDCASRATHEGFERKGVRKMNRYERGVFVLVVLVLGLVSWQVWSLKGESESFAQRQAFAVSNLVARVDQRLKVTAATAAASTNGVWDSWHPRIAVVGDWFKAGGAMYSVGSASPWGRVLEVHPDGVLCQGEAGDYRRILPFGAGVESLGRRRPELRRQVSSVQGRAAPERIGSSAEGVGTVASVN